MYISLHSFGELILYPWSHTKKPIHDWHELDAMARRWSDVVFQSSKGKYKYRVSNEYLNNSMSLFKNLHGVKNHQYCFCLCALLGRVSG